MMVQSCDPRNQEVEAGGSEAEGCLQLYGKFQANLGPRDPVLKKSYEDGNPKYSYHGKIKYPFSEWSLHPDLSPYYLSPSFFMAVQVNTNNNFTVLFLAKGGMPYAFFFWHQACFLLLEYTPWPSFNIRT